MMPDQTKPFQIECDTSKYALGAVLTQLDSNRDHHPVALSKTFNEMVIGLKIEYPWIIHFSLILNSN